MPRIGAAELLPTISFIARYSQVCACHFLAPQQRDVRCAAVRSECQYQSRESAQYCSYHLPLYGPISKEALTLLTVQALENGQTTLIEVVQSLGEYVNDEDITNRARTIEYLSQIIGGLSLSFLSRQQIRVLCQFLCDRIEDGGAAGGLKKLQSMERYNSEMAVLTFRA